MPKRDSKYWEIIQDIYETSRQLLRLIKLVNGIKFDKDLNMNYWFTFFVQFNLGLGD